MYIKYMYLNIWNCLCFDWRNVRYCVLVCDVCLLCDCDWYCLNYTPCFCQYIPVSSTASLYDNTWMWNELLARETDLRRGRSTQNEQTTKKPGRASLAELLGSRRIGKIVRQCKVAAQWTVHDIKTYTEALGNHAALADCSDLLFDLWWGWERKTRRLLERDELSSLSRGESRATVGDRVVSDGEFTQVVTDHIRLDLDGNVVTTVVDTDDGSNHLRDDDHITKVSLDGLRLLISVSLLLLWNSRKDERIKSE